MTADRSRPVPGYRLFRLFFVGVNCVVWFLLLWGLGYLVASQLPGEGPLPFRTARLFFLVAFFFIPFFSAPGTFIGFLRQHLEGAFTLPSGNGPVKPPLLWRSQQPIHPWILGLSRVLLFWIPSVLLALLFLRLGFPGGIGRGALALSLAGLGAVLAGVIAGSSSGRLFFHEIYVPPEHRVWRGSVSSYLFWRHGIPWGISNAILNAILAFPLFPGNPGSEYGVASPLLVSMDILFTSINICFFMAISATPHALVDTRLGLISAPERARSPARGGRIGWFLLFSLGVALGTMAGLKVAGIEDIMIRGFVPWKGLAAGGIAGVAAMTSAYWTLAREAAA